VGPHPSQQKLFLLPFSGGEISITHALLPIILAYRDQRRNKTKKKTKLIKGI
jgi:hypothetical protein